MHEKIVTANRNLTCDLCGRRIYAGTKCRIVHDDYMSGITFFEHLNCPGAKSATVEEPIKPLTVKTLNIAIGLA